MNCDNCGSRVEKKWSYCPYCGVRLSKNKGLDDIFKIIYNEINSVMGHSNAGVNIKFKRQKKSTHNVDAKFTKVKEVVEPLAYEEQSNGKKIIRIPLPGVNKNNIEIKRLGESLEIRAVGKDKGYFKVIPLGKKDVVDSYLYNNELVIELV